tara:strand:+ start:2488 stop:3387 length:900 start_codon:yes stop_codon:yes gene_type:complete
MEDLNKISSTRVGDNIHFYVNGQENKGTVVKMDTSYVTVIKDDGNFQDIHINDTFFIKDILVNKTWNDMTMEERTVALHEIKAYSPRFLAKSWQELPTELKDVMLKGFGGAAPRKVENDDQKYLDSVVDDWAMRDLEKNPKGHGIGKPKRQEPREPNESTSPQGGQPKSGRMKSNVEQSHLGSAGRASHVVETSTAFDAEEDYEGQSHDTKEEQFKHDKEKPKVTNKTMQEQLWEEWLSKDGSGNMGDGGAPAQTSMTTGTTGVYNPVYGKDGRIKGQEKDKEEDTEKDKESEEKERKG